MEFNYVLCIITVILCLFQISFVYLMGGVQLNTDQGVLTCPTIFSDPFKYNITDKAWNKGLEIKRGPKNQPVLELNKCRKSDYSRYLRWHLLFFPIIIGLIMIIIIRLTKLITKDEKDDSDLSSKNNGYKISDLVLTIVTTISCIISLITGGTISAITCIINIISVISIIISIYF